MLMSANHKVFWQEAERVFAALDTFTARAVSSQKNFFTSCNHRKRLRGNVLNFPAHSQSVSRKFPV